MKLRDKVKEQAMQMREGDNQRSPLKGRFTRFIRHRMKWHASPLVFVYNHQENVLTYLSSERTIKKIRE